MFTSKKRGGAVKTQQMAARSLCTVRAMKKIIRLQTNLTQHPQNETSNGSSLENTDQAKSELAGARKSGGVLDRATLPGPINIEAFKRSISSLKIWDCSSDKLNKSFGQTEEERFLIESIKRVGIISPPVIMPNGEILAGIEVVKAAEFLGIDSIPVNTIRSSCGFEKSVVTKHARIQRFFSGRNSLIGDDCDESFDFPVCPVPPKSDGDLVSIGSELRHNEPPMHTLGKITSPRIYQTSLLRPDPAVEGIFGPHPNESKLHFDIRRNGITSPLLILEDGRVVDGCSRLKAAIQNGIKEIQVVVIYPTDKVNKLEIVLKSHTSRVLSDVQHERVAKLTTQVRSMKIWLYMSQKQRSHCRKPKWLSFE